MRKTYLITGGAGFIGSALVRYLIQNTEHRVVNIDKLTYAGNLDSLFDVINDPSHIFIQSDITERAAMDDILSKYQPDGIIHLAAESHVDRSIDGPDDFIYTNINGTYTLLESTRSYWRSLSKDLRKKFRFLHVSTDEVYGDLNPDDNPFNEESQYNPSSPYSASKAASDHMVRAWQRTYDLPVIVTNCSNNYGPYQFPEKLIPHIILNALSGKPLCIYGDGQQIRDWLYVEDHIRGLLDVLNKGKVGLTYNIGSNNEHNNLNVVKQICNHLEEIAPDKKSSEIDYYSDLIQFVEDRPGHDRRYAIDPSKIKHELNWHPKESFESGLRKTIQWYLDNEEWWRRILNGSYRLERIGMNNSNMNGIIGT